MVTFEVGKRWLFLFDHGRWGEPVVALGLHLGRHFSELEAGLLGFLVVVTRKR